MTPEALQVKRRHVVVTCAGSRGDVEPWVALALALRAAGCDVTVAAEPRLACFAAAAGLPTRLLRSDASGMLFDEECLKVMTAPGDPGRNLLKAIPLWAKKQDMHADLKIYEVTCSARQRSASLALFARPHSCVLLSTPAHALKRGRKR